MDEAKIEEWVDQLADALATVPGTNWWAVCLPPLAVIGAALLAFFLGRKTLKQKQESDDRAEWWRRTQWALEATDSSSDRLFSYGVEMLRTQTESRLAGDEETGFIRRAWDEGRALADRKYARDLDDTKAEIMAENPGLSEDLVDRLARLAVGLATTDQSTVDERASNGDNEGNEEVRR